ncbi:MAG: SPOR domain-containing protein [Deltaproteobacteria bacterium]|jgi:cell division septation protein DedD|nr:SPOR domain-containing protein [Deltaproteobacteria bacterium]
MNPTLLKVAIGALAVLALVLFVISRQRNKKKRPVAGGRGPVRFSRESLETPTRGKPSKNRPASTPVATIAVYAAGAILLAWVGLSFANRLKENPNPAEAAAPTPPLPSQSEGAQEEPPKFSASLSGKLEPPPSPPPVSSFAPDTQEIVAAPVNSANLSTPVNSANTAAPVPELLSSPAASAGQAMISKRELPSVLPNNFVPFEPSNLPSSENMIVAAKAMAPDISRMEPVGRNLTPPSDDGQAEKPLVNRGAPPVRPKLTAPPARAAAPVARPPVVTPGQKRSYTVLLGSFVKPENANNLRDKLQAAGLPVTVTEVTIKNKVWFRVMSGAFEDQGSAEAYVRELKQRNLVDNPVTIQ